MDIYSIIFLQKVKKLILVAPWKIPDKDDKNRIDFYTYPIDESIKERVNEIIMFTADDEEDEGKESLKIYNESLGGKIMTKEEFTKKIKELGYSVRFRKVTFEGRKTYHIPDVYREGKQITGGNVFTKEFFKNIKK